MRQTRSEMIKALRQTLGQSEETEHVIDWMQDAWSTYDHLSKSSLEKRMHARSWKPQTKKIDLLNWKKASRMSAPLNTSIAVC
jgi:hypothetical protein